MQIKILYHEVFLPLHKLGVVSSVIEFGPSVFYLFGPSVKNSVLWFSIYSVLRIRSTVPARFCW